MIAFNFAQELKCTKSVKTIKGFMSKQVNINYFPDPNRVKNII